MQYIHHFKTDLDTATHILIPSPLIKSLFKSQTINSAKNGGKLAPMV
ncbi:hypothetical protein MCQ_01160 [Candidatus Bartonella washoeensis Sb944nv]|uniref:Uncharacterized protein n=1 Tax=Candidatus Bartonella washoeensis Sb944nv TaxID=1094563 RepID=J0Q1A8_9HYPH|nr:hypothetical protein MCQ_01160 [Bartonella washoeensis Sb944nv]